MRTFSPTRAAIIALVALLAGTAALTVVAARQSSGQVVMAEFHDVGSVNPGQQVKVHGVAVGEVGEPTILPRRGTALVPLHLEPSALPVHVDATARVAPLSLLGELFIDLDTGTPSEPVLAPGGTIPASQTSRAQDLQSVLNTLDDPTASSLSALLVSLGQGMDNNGRNIQQTIAALAPAMQNTKRVAEVLREQNELLGGVIDRVEPVTRALAADHGARMNGLVDSAEKLLGAAAARDRRLRATLAELPGTLSEATRTLAVLQGTARTTSVTLSELRPTTEHLATISRELGTFSASAAPAVTASRPLLARANRLLEQARPVAALLRRSGPSLQGSLEAARPLAAELRDNLGNVLGFIRNWALTTNGRDGLSHYFRAHFIVSPDTVTGYVPGGMEDGARDPGTEEHPRPRRNRPQNQKTLRDVDEALRDVRPRAPQRPKLPSPKTLLDQEPNPGRSATGLTEQQEREALSFLLGDL